MQYGIGVKIIILNNNFLGMVRQWQEIFYHKRYSETEMINPDFVALASAYGIKAENVENRTQLDGAIERMLQHEGAYILNVNIESEANVFPMVPAGSVMSNTILSATEKYEN